MWSSSRNVPLLPLQLSGITVCRELKAQSHSPRVSFRIMGRTWERALDLSESSLGSPTVLKNSMTMTMYLPSVHSVHLHLHCFTSLWSLCCSDGMNSQWIQDLSSFSSKTYPKLQGEESPLIIQSYMRFLSHPGPAGVLSSIHTQGPHSRDCHPRVTWQFWGLIMASLLGREPPAAAELSVWGLWETVSCPAIARMVERKPGGSGTFQHWYLSVSSRGQAPSHSGKWAQHDTHLSLRSANSLATLGVLPFQPKLPFLPSNLGRDRRLGGE